VAAEAAFTAASGARPWSRVSWPRRCSWARCSCCCQPCIPRWPALWADRGLVTLFVLVYSGGHFFRGAWKSFRNHNANMDTLIALGTGAAWVYSMAVAAAPQLVPTLAQHAYFEAAAVIIALINLGQLLEIRARGKTSQAIKRLIGLQPRTARVVRDGKELDIPIEEVGLSEPCAFVRVRRFR